MRRISIAAVLCLLAAPAAAQEDDYSKVEIKVEKVAPGVAVLFGAGGNIGLSYGDDGNVIIDDQFAPLTDKIVAAVKTLDPDPVKFVINTHWHGDHTGGNENFGKAGAVIVAHDNVRTRMAADQVTKALEANAARSARDALPVVTFGDGVTFHLNGDTLHVIHLSNAHTDGDSIVHWQNADVLHMGDTFFHQVTFPYIDLGSKGSIQGLVKAIETALQFAKPSTRIIPGHGPVATRQDLVAYHDMLVDIRDKVAAGIAANQTLDQIKASGPAARYGMKDGFVSPDQFVETVYKSLREHPAAPGNKKHDHH